MASKYQSLAFHSLEGQVTYRRPAQVLPERVTAESPATDVFTDFSKVAAISMGPCATLDQGEKRMIASGVRMLLVIDQSNHLLGVVSSADLHGERPMKKMQESGSKREELFLLDIMTPIEVIQVLDMKQVERSSVGEIIETMKHVRRQHALVKDHDSSGEVVIRGLFSTKQISLQLGIDFVAADVDTTFAHLDEAIAS